MRTVLALLVAAFCGVGVACGGEEGGGEAEPDLTGPEGYSQQKLLVSQVSCTCQRGGGQLVPADDPCVQADDLGMRTACEERVLDQRWAELQAGGECLEEGFRKMKECLLVACELERCYRLLQSDTGACPQNVKDAFLACQ